MFLGIEASPQLAAERLRCRIEGVYFIGWIMALTEGQIAGSVVVLAIATFMYLGSLFFPRYHQEKSPAPFLTRSSSSIAIELAGDGIDNSGIYFVPEGITILDFLEKINIQFSPEISNKSSKVKLLPGSSLIITRNGEEPPQITIGKMNATQRIALGLPIDINHASNDDLQLVPGIGEKTSLQIISLRETTGKIHHLDELMNIKGIKEKRLAKLKKYLYVDEPQQK